MLTAQDFNELKPENVGTFQHYNDTFMAQTQVPSAPASSYIPPAYSPDSSSTRAGGSVPNVTQATQPNIVIIDRQPSWASSYFSGFFDAMLFTRSRASHTTVFMNPSSSSNSSSQDTRNRNKNEIAQAGIVAATLFFAGLIAVAGIGIAYSYSELSKITENLVAKRKMLSNAIKLGTAMFLGYAGLKMGVQLGAYYGPALLGTAFLGSVVASTLLATATMSAGILAGKYFAKLIQYVHSRGKNTNNDPFTLLPSQALAIENTFSNESPFQGSRANLMKGYIVNKIEIAQNLNAPKAWIENLKAYKKQLKSGQVSQELRNYFDSEFNLIRNTWYQETMVPQADSRFLTNTLSKVEHEFNALAVITNQEAILQQDLQYVSTLKNPAPTHQYQHQQTADPLYPDLQEFNLTPNATSMGYQPTYEHSRSPQQPTPPYNPEYLESSPDISSNSSPRNHYH